MAVSDHTDIHKYRIKVKKGIPLLCDDDKKLT